MHCYQDNANTASAKQWHTLTSRPVVPTLQRGNEQIGPTLNHPAPKRAAPFWEGVPKRTFSQNHARCFRVGAAKSSLSYHNSLRKWRPVPADTNRCFSWTYDVRNACSVSGRSRATPPGRPRCGSGRCPPGPDDPRPASLTMAESAPAPTDSSLPGRLRPDGRDVRRLRRFHHRAFRDSAPAPSKALPFESDGTRSSDVHRGWLKGFEPSTPRSTIRRVPYAALWSTTKVPQKTGPCKPGG
jgi:hypothetical protein